MITTSKSKSMDTQSQKLTVKKEYANIEDEVHFIEMQKSEIRKVTVGKKIKTNKF